MATMMEVDTDKAKLFAKGLKDAKPPAPEGGGSFGGAELPELPNGNTDDNEE
jgi:hypothetical protein